jgi:hypothetical protein
MVTIPIGSGSNADATTKKLENAAHGLACKFVLASWIDRFFFNALNVTEFFPIFALTAVFKLEPPQLKIGTLDSLMVSYYLEACGKV